MRFSTRWVSTLTLLILTPSLGKAEAEASADAPKSKEEQLVFLNQEKTEVDFGSLSLEDLLNGNVTVVTRQEVRELDSPGIVTVITREEILNSGARDLLDVFQLIPGINIAQDSFGTVSISLRGIWAQEGKVLVQWDGHEMNERGYGIHEFQNRYPLDQIERVEVIRGPGSVTYGQFAELGVINIITRGATQLDGVSASAVYGQATHGLGQRDVSVEVAHRHKDWSYAVSAFVGQGERSDQTYRDFGTPTSPPQSYPMSENSALNPLLLGADFSYKDLTLKFLFDNFNMQTRDVSGPVNPQAYRQRLTGYYALAQYDVHPSSSWTLTPLLTFKSQDPFTINDPSSPVYFNVIVRHFSGKLTTSYRPSGPWSLRAGAEVYQDEGVVLEPITVQGGPPYAPGTTGTGINTVWPNGGTVSRLVDAALFAEGTFESFLGNLTLGARYEHQNAAGTARGQLFGSIPVIPRAALTKTLGAFHFKLLASEAFRAPTLENLAFAAGPIVPELTTVYEAEAGYQLSTNNYVAANVFDLRVKRPLAYTDDPATGAQVYTNSSVQLASRGVEVVYRLKRGPHYATATYSFYSAGGLDEAAYYTGATFAAGAGSAPINPRVLLGAPAHKVSLQSSIALSESLSLNPSGTFLSGRYGFIDHDASSAPIYGSTGNTLLLNAFLRYRNVAGIKGLDAGVGVYNLLNSGYSYVQAYASGHPNLPASSRQYVGRVLYQVPF